MNYESLIHNYSFNSAQSAGAAMDAIREKERQESDHRAALEAGANAAVSQQKLLEQQISLLKEQNCTLSENYAKLEEMYRAQVKDAEDSKEELHRSRKFNGWMMVIAVISMLAAVAGPIITIFSGM